MLNEQLIIRMNGFNAGHPDWIQHLIKVYEYAHVIGVSENIDPEKLKILDIAAILHDIGIRPCMERFGSCEGPLQEKYGPDYARELLKAFPDVTADETERICFLIGHHHTYEGVDDIDWQILLEADYLVNSFEGGVKKEAVRTFRDRVFRTGTGICLLDRMYELEQ